MKWFVLPIICSALFWGCSRLPDSSQKRGKPRVLSTTAMIGNLVEKIGGEAILHQVLITGDLDPHSYEIVKGDDEKIISAEILFFNGLGLEHGASLRYHLTHHSNAVALGDLLYQQDKEKFLQVGEELDPHIWMDVSLWAKLIPLIRDELTEKIPQHEELFFANAEILEEELRALDEKISLQFQKIPSEVRYLVSSHDAFNYFTRRYLADPDEKNWQERFKAPEGLAPDGQLSLGDLSKIIDHLCAHQIPVVFPESNLSRDALKKIISVCSTRGVAVSISDRALFGDTMGSCASYFQMMEHNGNVISEEIMTKVVVNE